MRINISNNAEKVITIVARDGDVVDFDEFKPQAAWKFKYDELLNEINGYWATLPNAEQDELFALYEDISDTLLSSASEDECMLHAQKVIKIITDVHHDLPRVLKYIRSLNLPYPPSVHKEFTSNENRKSRVGTYLQDDYDELIAIAVVTRALMPIWMQLRELQRSNDNEHRVFGDLAILSTMRYTQFIKSEPMVRLFDYVNSVYGKQEGAKTLGSIVAGIGSEEIPNYLYASAIVNRLAIRPIITEADEGTLVSSIHERVRTDVGKLGERFQVMRERKESRMGDGGDEDKTGYLETFSVRQLVSNDVHIANGVYLKDYRGALADLDNTISAARVKECLDSQLSNPIAPILPLHVYIVQYTLYRSMYVVEGDSGPRRLVMEGAVPHLKRDEMVKAMAIAQAALIHWDMRDIAVLLSSSPLPTSPDDYIGIRTPFLPFKPALRDSVAKSFSNYRPNGEKSSKNLYPPFLAVTNLIQNHIANREWKLKCSAKVARALRQEQGTYLPCTDLRNVLLELIIKVAK